MNKENRSIELDEADCVNDVQKAVVRLVNKMVKYDPTERVAISEVMEELEGKSRNNF